MGQSKRTELATAVALIVAGAATALPAEAQSPLTVYSRDFGGPNSSAPSGAQRDTVIAMGVPRLHAVHQRLLEVRRILQTHGIPPHDHPHSHGPCVTPTAGDGGDGDGDGYGDGDGGGSTGGGSTGGGSTGGGSTGGGSTGGGGDTGDSCGSGAGNGGSPP